MATLSRITALRGDEGLSLQSLIDVSERRNCFYLEPEESNPVIALSRDFLNKFMPQDNIVIAGQVLESYWGVQNDLFLKPSSLSTGPRYVWSESGIALRDYRAKRLPERLSIIDLEKQLHFAMNHNRATTVTVYTF